MEDKEKRKMNIFKSVWKRVTHFFQYYKYDFIAPLFLICAGILAAFLMLLLLILI